MNPKLLLFTAQLELFYQLYSIVLFVESNAYHYCFCEKVPGCPKIDRFDGWCLICLLQEEYSSLELEKIKDSPGKLLNFAQRLYLHLFDIIEFDDTIAELWVGDFIHSGRSYNGEQWWVPLRNCIESILYK